MLEDLGGRGWVEREGDQDRRRISQEGEGEGDQGSLVASLEEEEGRQGRRRRVKVRTETCSNLLSSSSSFYPSSSYTSSSNRHPILLQTQCQSNSIPSQPASPPFRLLSPQKHHDRSSPSSASYPSSFQPLNHRFLLFQEAKPLFLIQRS